MNSEKKKPPPEEYGIDRLFTLKDKVSLVTGGSGGLGSAIASALAGCGSTVVISARNIEKLKKVKDQTEASGRKVSIHRMDVLNAKEVEKEMESVYQEYGRIDILVNAHGINRRIPTPEYPLKTWEEIVDTNLKGTFITCKAVAKYMIRQKLGKIINISSTAAASGYAWGYSAYSPSKAGVDSLTRTLAVEWGKYGITVNSIAPYFVYTELTQKFLSDPSMSRKLVRDVPLGRLGYPRDVVGAVVFFAAPASDWVSGQVLYVDGGYMAH